MRDRNINKSHAYTNYMHASDSYHSNVHGGLAEAIIPPAAPSGEVAGPRPGGGEFPSHGYQEAPRLQWLQAVSALTETSIRFVQEMAVIAPMHLMQAQGAPVLWMVSGRAH